MRNLSGKRFILGLMALILCVTTCVLAFASVGDRVLFYSSDLNGNDNEKILNLFPYGDGFIIVMQKGNGQDILKYADISAEPETFIWKDSALSEEAEQDMSAMYVNNWFGWNDGIYAIIEKSQFSEDSGYTEFLVRKARLEGDQVILENADLPELDLTSLVKGEDDNQYVQNIMNLFVADDKLVIIQGEEWIETLEAISLRDGYCTEIEPDECGEIVPGPEGTLLMTKAEWNGSDNTATIRISSIDMDGRNEKQLAEIPGCVDGMIMPCYDPEKDTLYFVRNGELCAMPRFDSTRMETVNSCSRAGEAAYMLPGGFILMKTTDSVMIKNTDPAQRGNVTLRIRNDGWGTNVMSETVYDMNNVRGDVSVVLQDIDEVKMDILQAMLTQDASIDIYMLHYDSNEFSTLRSRDYLPDLSGNEKIVANTNRMYPYLQDAMKQNGKIIGVPVYFSGRTIGINKELWKQIGGTEEELPKTWNQFFDWIKTLPKRLEGKDASFIGGTDRAYFRGEILHMLMNQYEVLMERKGEKDYAFANPIMCDLVQQLNDVDFDALRVSDHWHWEEDDTYENPEAMKAPLLQIGTSTLMAGQNEFTPMALRLMEEEEAVLPVEMHVAFLNPFSSHQEEAIEFLALATDNLDFYDAYTAYADMTEPLRDPDYEEIMKIYSDIIEEMIINRDKAKGEEREEIEKTIENLEKNRQEDEQNLWQINSRMIDRYQKWQNLYKVQGYTFFNDLFTADNDEERYEEFEEIFRNMENAKMSPEELLGMLDQKVWMMRVERN
ncbi:carbohydrate ABC transporter substrate-binding protein [Clostridiales bacterium FE2010]|nr:carbohydrate ABC transporter substrate-binding protein [Clostridiales bacterium FE2010]